MQFCLGEVGRGEGRGSGKEAGGNRNSYKRFHVLFLFMVV